MEAIKKVDLSHTFLFVALVFSVLGFILPQDYSFQFQIGIILLVFYLISQLVHHFFDRSLTKEVALEYILLAVLMSLILLKIIL